jgi:hypothetical protein
LNKYTTFLAALAVLGSSAAYADGISLKESRGFSSNLEVKCNGVNLGTANVLGNKAITITAKDANPSYLKDAPELPQYTAMVMINPSEKPVITAKSLESEIIELDAPVIPSKGNFKRTIDPESVPYNYGKIYKENKWYPSDKDLVKIGDPFIFREIRGVNLIVSPVQYNPVKNKIRIHKNIQISVGSEPARSVNTLTKNKPISKAFEPIYKNTFINFSQGANRLPRLNEVGRLLIITADEYADAMKPFVDWKKKCGLAVKMVPMSQVGTTNTDVKAFIQKEFNKGGLTNIMLVGDSDKIPSNKGVNEGADSDTCYVKLAGDDHVPDAIISRLTAENVEGVAYQVAKFLNYEQYTTKDTSWYTRLFGIGSAEGSPTDHEYIDQLRQAHLAKGDFKSAEKAYDPGATQQDVLNAVNKGVSLINYLGHGSGTGWGTTRFSNSWMSKLDNGWKMPILFDVACLNGRFVNFTGFGESWMRAGNIEKPAGLVAYVGATTSMAWVPPIHVQAEINKNLIVNETYKTVGGLYMNGIMKGLELYTAEPKGDGVQILEQWHLFGDSTLQVRFKAPAEIKAEPSIGRTNGDSRTVKINVEDKKGKPVSNARVAIYGKDVKKVRIGYTNNQGQAAITIPSNLDSGYMTVTGADITPIVDQPIKF